MIDILATGGSVETPRITRGYWSVLAGAAGATLLIITHDAALAARCERVLTMADGVIVSDMAGKTA